MATKIVTKNSSTASAVPTAAQLVQGELAVNVADKRLFTEDNGGSIVELGTNPSTLTVTGEITANGGIALGDNDRIKLGDGPDLQIWHNGSNSYVMDSGTGNLKLLGSAAVEIQSQADNSNMIVATAGGAVTLYNANSPKLATTSTGINVTGNITGLGKIISDTFQIERTNGEIYVQPVPNAGVKLFWNGAERLDTTSTGIDVTGTATMDGLTVDGSLGSFAVQSSGAEVHFSRNNNNDILANGGTSASFTIGANNNLTFKTGATLTQRLQIASNGNLSLYEDTGTTAKFFWDASAESLGIGTSAPQALGHIYTESGINTADTLLKLTNVANTARYVGFQAQRDNASGQGLNILITKTDASVVNALTIDTAANVGIGTSSPDTLLNIASSSAPTLRIENTDTGLAANQTIGDIDFYQNDPSGGGVGVVGKIRSINSSGFQGEAGLAFHTGTTSGLTERMRIDSSGNLLVGNTDSSTGGTVAGHRLISSGFAYHTRDGGLAAAFNRLTSDGAIAEFRKDGTTVGSIGSVSGVATYMVFDPRSSLKGAGLTGGSVDSNTGILLPTDKTGASVDDAIQLGTGSKRFKDLYLSGGVYLGGTGDANKLDDYEEGTWTPTLEGDTSGSAPLTVTSASYTKIGNTVHAYCYLSAIDLSADDIVGNMVIKGLPFNVSTNNLQSVAITYQALSATYLNMSGRLSSGFIRLQQDASNFSLARTDCVTTSGKVIMVGCTYPTNA